MQSIIRTHRRKTMGAMPNREQRCGGGRATETTGGNGRTNGTGGEKHE